jgi:hypothetical protein
MANTISYFDFRSYLFARQAHLLGQLRHIGEVARRAVLFMATFSQTLRESGVRLSLQIVAESITDESFGKGYTIH